MSMISIYFFVQNPLILRILLGDIIFISNHGISHNSYLSDTLHLLVPLCFRFSSNLDTPLPHNNIHLDSFGNLGYCGRKHIEIDCGRLLWDTRLSCRHTSEITKSYLICGSARQKFQSHHARMSKTS